MKTFSSHVNAGRVCKPSHDCFERWIFMILFVLYDHQYLSENVEKSGRTCSNRPSRVGDNFWHDKMIKNEKFSLN